MKIEENPDNQEKPEKSGKFRKNPDKSGNQINFWKRNHHIMFEKQKNLFCQEI